MNYNFLKYPMKHNTILFVSLIALLLFSQIQTIKLNPFASHAKDEKPNKADDSKNNTQGQDGQISCTQQQCMDAYGLSNNFNPWQNNCKSDDAKCQRQWAGMPDCEDDDEACWKNATGYPTDCKQDDYDCWLKFYGYPVCKKDDVKCLKEYLGYKCEADDFDCWKNSTYANGCDWNDWDCQVEKGGMSWLCGDKKGFECMKVYYGQSCKKDDEDCWRKLMWLPSAQCAKDIVCWKEANYLPTCKDDDYACWKKQTYGPQCESGDMKCLKEFLWLPKCDDAEDKTQCYKQWLGYPDCTKDDAACWKQYNDNNNFFFFFHHSKSIQASQHMMAGGSMQHNMKPVSFGNMMHKKRMSPNHHKNSFHAKKKLIMSHKLQAKNKNAL